nr:hypothetical protein [Tanacetum cinerariifolium]
MDYAVAQRWTKLLKELRHFVIFDMVEDFRMPIILGRPLLVTAHVEVDVIRKLISLDEDCEDLENFREEKKELILDAVLDNLDDDWFTGTINDEDDLDGRVDYLELKLHDDFVDINEKYYKDRTCKLLGKTYKRPSPILIKKVEVPTAGGWKFVIILACGYEEISSCKEMEIHDHLGM